MSLGQLMSTVRIMSNGHAKREAITPHCPDTLFSDLFDQFMTCLAICPSHNKYAHQVFIINNKYYLLKQYIEKKNSV